MRARFAPRFFLLLSAACLVATSQDATAGTAAGSPELGRGRLGKAPWEFDVAGVERAWKLAGPKAKGAGVRILDIGTGVDRDVHGLRERVEKGRYLGKDSLRAKKLPYEYYDEAGHGTSVAGALVARSDGRGVAGVAPRAKLLVGKLPPATHPRAYLSAIIEGIRWGIQEKVDIINMSLIIPRVLGDPGSKLSVALAKSLRLGNRIPELSAALWKAYDAGIVITASAGNDGAEKMGLQAIHPAVLAVGAVGRDLKRAPWSQYGPELSLMTPALELKSAYPRGQGRRSTVEISADGATFSTVPSLGHARSPFVAEGVTGPVRFAGDGSRAGFRGFRRGSVALIDPNKIPLARVLRHAAQAGAAAVLYTRRAGDFSSPYVSLQEAETDVPVAFVESDAGQNMKEALLRGRPIDSRIKIAPSDDMTFSGTSGAAPLAAGYAALVKAVDSTLSAAQIHRMLKETATHVPARDNQYGRGIVRADRAVLEALRNQDRPSPQAH